MKAKDIVKAGIPAGPLVKLAMGLLGPAARAGLWPGSARRLSRWTRVSEVMGVLSIGADWQRPRKCRNYQKAE